MRFIVHAGGKKSSRLLARINGKQENLDVGDLSLMTLADARTKAKGMLAMIANGEDPRTAKREAIKAASETVEIAARRFIERHAKVHNRTWRETEQRIEREILPHWGKRPLASIEQADVVALLDAIVDRGGAGISANRTLGPWARSSSTGAVERGTGQGILAVRPRPDRRCPKSKRDRVHTLPELRVDPASYRSHSATRSGRSSSSRILAGPAAGGNRGHAVVASLMPTISRSGCLPAARAKNAVQASRCRS